jgi:PhzF family phenazine biosynthesis protein
MRIFHVDAFTDKPFRGNPAAVCLLDRTVKDQWMQDLATEMNLSETAFVKRGPEGFDLRWFTPVDEVDLCGHATLAAAHILWEMGRLKFEEVARFRTLSGILTASKKETWIELDFPSEPAEASETPDGLVEALGVRPLWVGRNRMDYLVEVKSETEVREVQPDFNGLRKVACRGVILTSQASTAGYDFVSRCFFPLLGVDEDPVTGSAHCCLAPFWSDRLKKLEMVGFQASARGGDVGVRLEGDRVTLLGQAVTVLACRLTDDLERSSGMEDKKSYQAKMEDQFQRLGTKIDELLELIEGDARVGYDRVSDEVRKSQKVVEKKLGELKESSAEAWQDAKPGLEKAWGELRSIIDKVSSRF